jgi:hypothetical protein
MDINLNRVRMKTAKADPKGACSSETVLEFQQDHNLISATYRGGPVVDGYLIGVLNGSQVRFRYVQADVSGNVDAGVSDGTFSRLPNGKLQLTEHFLWYTRPDSGTNIFVEL